MFMVMTRKKTDDNKNKTLIHRVMTENGKENIWDTFKKLIEECPYDTTPA